MEILDGPVVETAPERHTAGIRIVTPFRGMFAVRDKLMTELYGWLDERGADYGRTFLRLQVVAMESDMELEVGVLTDKPIDGDGRIEPGTLPAGDYAILRFVGHGRRANSTLINWIRAEGLPMDVDENPAGDRFGGRYEMYLTDPRSERMKTKWQIELGIHLDLLTAR
ncbi:GyrI-like domain-containing protein [Paractinoplanes lichenicola]|uniref:GyrI-like domain-containing protein n=1 Tax=Paractinoplanes lichenicola TaxID=2802976 RepID=A0ABS1VXZ8_9ACTN|nr:GyrI-like domain-containing protein [Actinoplanes lichenicola]MBL7259350.1 GyrI-like domain-containing protein [Actinoplanes lichenicola]